LAQQGASLFDEQAVRFDNEATRVSSEIPARDLLADIPPPVPSHHLSLNATRRYMRRLVRKEAA
jgi:hypothetical protein